MAKAKCVIDIMKENEYIKVEKQEEYSHVIDVFRIEKGNIYDHKKAEEIIDKIEEKIKQSNEYVVAVKYRNGHICFAKANDVHKFVASFIDANTESKRYNSMPYYIRKYIEEEYPNISISGDRYATHMTDTTKREKRQKKEEENDKKALELLNNIL